MRIVFESKGPSVIARIAATQTLLAITIVKFDGFASATKLVGPDTAPTDGPAITPELKRYKAMGSTTNAD